MKLKSLDFLVQEISIKFTLQKETRSTIKTISVKYIYIYPTKADLQSSSLPEAEPRRTQDFWNWDHGKENKHLASTLPNSVCHLSQFLLLQYLKHHQ